MRSARSIWVTRRPINSSRCCRRKPAVFSRRDRWADAGVRQRAENRCEYCGLTQERSPVAKLQIEHVIPRKHGGGDDVANLALACIDCNLHKGANLTGIDPETGSVVEIFNPRSQRWADHFAWDALFLNGRTAVGRTTIRVLEINAEDRVRSRLVEF